MIQARNLIHKYDFEYALNDVSIDINKGTFVALSGESGSGKSTMLSILSTLLKPSSGIVLLNGVEVNNIVNIDKFRRENIGFVFQFHHLIQHLTLRENVELAAYGEFKKDLDSIFEKLGILGIANKYPNEISGGQRQRAAIARAIINRPKIIFADEPTGNLDSKNSINIYEIFKSLCNEGSTIVVASHDIGLKDFVDKTIRIKDGKIE
jgi:putative ABC transport system ATP-binding protein